MSHKILSDSTNSQEQIHVSPERQEIDAQVQKYIEEGNKKKR